MALVASAKAAEDLTPCALSHRERGISIRKGKGREKSDPFLFVDRAIEGTRQMELHGTIRPPGP
jgi:hypothetical protein